jgi:hypothetical protein
LPEAPTPGPAALRVCLDINIYIARQLAAQSGRPGGAGSRLVDIARDMTCEAGPVQLVMSLQIIGALEDVLGRLKFQQPSISDFTAALVALMRMGPEGFDPFLSPGAGGLAMKDTEDAGVLASCIASRVDLLVTDNLDDFRFNDAERIDTREVPRRGGTKRQLYTVIYQRNDGVGIVIAHPIDALEWLRIGLRPTPDAVRNYYGAASSVQPK